MVRNITITNIKGSGNSFGKIMGNPGTTEFGDILVKNIDVQLKTTTFEHADIKGLKFENVVVNGAPMAVSAPTIVPPKAQ
jgi:hypothetical protein